MFNFGIFLFLCFLLSFVADKSLMQKCCSAFVLMCYIIPELKD